MRPCHVRTREMSLALKITGTVEINTHMHVHVLMTCNECFTAYSWLSKVLNQQQTVPCSVHRSCKTHYARDNNVSSRLLTSEPTRAALEAIMPLSTFASLILLFWYDANILNRGVAAQIQQINTGYKPWNVKSDLRRVFEAPCFVLRTIRTD